MSNKKNVKNINNESDSAEKTQYQEKAQNTASVRDQISSCCFLCL